MKPTRLTYESKIHAHPRGDVLRALCEAHRETIASYGRYYRTHVVMIVSITDAAAMIGERGPLERSAPLKTVCIPGEPAKLLPSLRALRPEFAAAIEARLARRQGDAGVLAVLVSALGLEACCALAPLDVMMGTSAMPTRGGDA